MSVFIESFAPPPRMIIFGAVDFTAALAKVAKILGYRVTVCDARPVFATRARFPMADEVVVAWPDKHLAEVGAALGPARRGVRAHPRPQVRRPGHHGGPGDRRRLSRGHGLAPDPLRIAPPGCSRPGSTTADLARVMGPIGLDIGARTPEETAVAICAEIIAMRTGRDRPVAPGQRGPHPPGPGRGRPPGVRLSRRVGAAILAAGGGSRFSAGPDAAHKLLAPWRGRPLVWAATANAVAVRV